MKRILSLALFGAAAAVLGGCPIYPDNPSDYRYCDGNACYDCPDNYYTGACVAWQCGGDYDCPGGYYCTGNGTCLAGTPGVDVPPSYDGGPVSTCSGPGDCPSGDNCGADNRCHPGDCSGSGCPAGSVCELSGGSLRCVTLNPPVDAGKDTGKDAGFSGCQKNSDCASVPGALCLDGVCVAPPNQCSDGTQCPPNDKCVQGACTPTCSPTVPCPTGYTCDANGVCTGNPTTCATNPGLCTGGTVCAQDHCVDPCSVAGKCPTGEVCIQGGCVPNQQPQFICATEGVQDACASGSLCLHHSCYIACTAADAGADGGDAGAGTCKGTDVFNQCKSVKGSNGSSYSVCGSSTNLGGECNPTTNQSCQDPKKPVCIDGYCH